MTNCEHVYKNMGSKICPLCGKDTHEVDWEKVNRLHAQWLLENPNAGGTVWWSI